jgi:uncharacterized protein (TIGR00730 family)
MGATVEYATAAHALGTALAQRQLGLVYGGGSVGLMGTVAKAVIDGGGTVTGILPRSLKTKEIAETIYGELIEVRTMHERKALMTRLTDAFIAMPGGFGTLDELFEALTWGQLGIHAKPIGLLNINGYFDGLIAWIDHALHQGFIRPQHRSLLVVDTEPAALLAKLAEHEPPAGVVKWLDFDDA